MLVDASEFSLGKVARSMKPTLQCLLNLLSLQPISGVLPKPDRSHSLAKRVRMLDHSASRNTCWVASDEAQLSNLAMGLPVLHQGLAQPVVAQADLATESPARKPLQGPSSRRHTVGQQHFSESRCLERRTRSPSLFSAIRQVYVGLLWGRSLSLLAAPFAPDFVGLDPFDRARFYLPFVPNMRIDSGGRLGGDLMRIVPRHENMDSIVSMPTASIRRQSVTANLACCR